ncbi:hypothetical protein VTO73DRAFT_6853 [Trametes versicolor]
MSPSCGRDAQCPPFPRAVRGLAPSPTTSISLQQLPEDLKGLRTVVRPLPSLHHSTPIAPLLTATPTTESTIDSSTASAAPSSSTKSVSPSRLTSQTLSLSIPSSSAAPQPLPVRSTPATHIHSILASPTIASRLPPAASASAAPLDDASFIFSPFSPFNTCASSTIRWTYSGPDEEVSFFISTTSTPSMQPDTPDFELVPGGVVEAALGSFTWEPVDFEPGWYVLVATGEAFETQSVPFFIGACDTTQPVLPSSTPTLSWSSLLPSDITLPTTTSNTSLPTPSTPSQALSSSSQSQGNKHAAVVAGGIIIAVTVLILTIVTFVCFRTALCRRSRTAISLPRDKRPYPSARWLGLSSSHSSLQQPHEDPAPPVRESVKSPPRLSAIEMPRSALARLEPNRRQPSMYIPSPVATSTFQPSPQSSIAKRGDSPTSLASPYKTRKPVPRLDLVEDMDGASAVRGFASTGAPSPEITSPVPSSATSKMYRTRDSGMSLRTEATSEREEAWRARASSIIDPHQFGAMKTMHSVVPDVPPLPQKY